VWVVSAALLSAASNACDKKSEGDEAQESTTGSKKEVPIHPQAKNVTVSRKDGKILAEMDVALKAKRVAMYYLKYLQSESWTLLDERRATDGLLIAGSRGRDRLTIVIRNRPNGVKVQIAKTQAGVAASKGSSPPAPLPPDISLPSGVRWDNRIYPAAGSSIELRGRCKCAVKKLIEMMRRALEAKGWTISSKSPSEVAATKGGREVKASAFATKKGVSAVRFFMAASEVTGRRDEGDESGAEKEGEPKKSSASGSAEGEEGKERSAELRDLLQKSLGVALPEEFSVVAASKAGAMGFQARIQHSSTDVGEVRRKLRRMLRKGGWKPLEAPRTGDAKGKETPMHLLMYEKPNQTLTGRLVQSPGGISVQLFQSSGS
jgi:hypothetical protein